MSVMPRTDFLDPRLLSPKFDLLGGFNQGLSTIGQLGNLLDIANQRKRVRATEDEEIAASNATNKFKAAGALADLGLLPSRTDVAGQELNLRGGQLLGDLSNLPLKTELDRTKLETSAAESKRLQDVLSQTTEPRTSTDLLNADVALGRAQTDVATLANKADAEIAKAETDKLAADVALTRQQTMNDFIAQNPRATVAELQAHLNKVDAENARALTQTAAGGLTPSEVTARENQARLDEISKGQLEVARQNATTNAAKIKAAANDPQKLARLHLELGKTVLSNGESVENSIIEDSRSPLNPKSWVTTNPNEADRAIMNQYMQLTRRIANLAAGGLAATGEAATGTAPATTPEDARARAIEILKKRGVIQ